MAKSHFVKVENEKDLGVKNLSIEVGSIRLYDPSGSLICIKELKEPRITLKVGERIQLSYVFTERDALKMIFDRQQAQTERRTRRRKGLPQLQPPELLVSGTDKS